MRNGQRYPLSRVVLAVSLMAGLSGCISEPPSSAEPGTAPHPAGVEPSESAGELSAKSTGRPLEPSARESGSSSKEEHSRSEQTTPSKISAETARQPKTWPEKSRKTDVDEDEAAEGFIAKTERMTSPNFGKKESNQEATLPSPPDYSGVAKGAALGELEAQFTEYANNNWQQTGETSIVGEPRVEDLIIDDVLTHRVYLCLDSSSIQITEPDGFIVTPKAEPGTRTALNIYDVQEHDGQLLVVDHLFPEDPDC